MVYPGDPAPKKQVLCDMAEGDLYNLTAFAMCSHNGTHVDAPAHFLQNGQTIDQIPMERYVGQAVVISHEGELTETHAQEILAKHSQDHAPLRLLVKGAATLTLPAAKIFAEAGIYLYGNESQTVGPEDSPMAVHLVLLGADVVLLEGVRLGHVPDGEYLLCAAPLCLGGAEGAPCRAVLMDVGR